MKSEPNLFNLATSELSQDAFFAWLLAWADDDHSGSVHELGRSFLNELFKRSNQPLPGGPLHVAVIRQHKHIDVFATINDGEAAIVLEDKVHAVEHGNQLDVYKKLILGDGRFKTVLCILCKTGDQSNYRTATKAGYTVINRPVLLELFSSEIGRQACAESEIVRSFSEHLKWIEKLTNAYADQPFKNWDWNAWKGLYMFFQKELKDGDWQYVPNRSEGFMGFYWHEKRVLGGSVYLQLEESRACFKVSVDDATLKDKLKFGWNERILAAAKQLTNLTIRIVRPRKMRIGTWMTVALVDGDIRAENNGLLDLQTSLERLREMELVLDAAVQSEPSQLVQALETPKPEKSIDNE